MKRLGLISLLAAAVLLSGCLAPSIAVIVDPTPITVQQGQNSISLTLKFQMSGLGFFDLGTATLILEDDNGAVLIDEGFSIDKERIPVVPGFSHSENYTLTFPADIEAKIDDPILYNEYLLGKTYLLKISITGTKNITTEVNVKFQ